MRHYLWCMRCFAEDCSNVCFICLASYSTKSLRRFVAFLFAVLKEFCTFLTRSGNSAGEPLQDGLKVRLKVRPVFELTALAAAAKTFNKPSILVIYELNWTEPLSATIHIAPNKVRVNTFLAMMNVIWEVLKCERNIYPQTTYLSRAFSSFSSCNDVASALRTRSPAWKSRLTQPFLPFSVPTSLIDWKKA